MLLRKEQLLSRLHFFIFGATIVGETAVTSLIVSSFGSEILGNLYFLNGGILLLLPVLFFKKIDSWNRGNLLKQVLKVASALITVIFIVYVAASSFASGYSRFILLLFYPVSYLLKTILFLTFWILATDISEPAETKTMFPRVASSGFIGGLSGAFASWILLNFLNAEFILLFWAILYLVAYISVNRVVESYNDKLIPKEVVPTAGSNHLKSLVKDTREVFTNSLVRKIAVLHFGIFVSIFLVDYHFWQQCSNSFSGAGKLSQFQYGFYIFHSLVTIALLRYVTPDLIALRGFTRIFSYLPITLLCGSIAYLAILYVWGANKFTFSVLLIWQLFRYLAFENFFSPIYQMFFAAVEREKRGRAKTVIEGLVKPLAIMTASALIFLIGKHSVAIVSVVLVFSLLLFFEALKIKHAYMKSLVRPSKNDEDEIGNLITSIGSNVEKECIDIINEFALSGSLDMKRAAIKLLVKMDRKESNSALNQLVMQSSDISLVREAARYAGEIKHNMFLTYFLVEHEDPKVWHRAVLSLILNRAHLNEFRTYLTRYFWVGETDDRVYAGMYLCSKEKSSDLPHLRSYLDTLYNGDKHCNVELAVLGYTVLRLDGWESMVLTKFPLVSSETCKILMRNSLEFGSDAHRKALIHAVVEADHGMSQELLLRELYRSAESVIHTVDQLLELFPKLSIEKAMPLIKALGSVRLNTQTKITQQLTGIQKYAEQKIVRAYEMAAALHHLPVSDTGLESYVLLKIAIHDQLLLSAECAVDTLAILDETGFVAEGRRDLRIEEPEERVALIELLESSKDSLLKDLTIPILESFDLSVYAEMVNSRLGKTPNTLKLLTSQDSLIVASTLYLLQQIGQGIENTLECNDTIHELAHSENEMVQTLAEMVLFSNGDTMGKNGEIIKVLNRVLFLKRSELFSSVSAVRLMRLAEGIQEIIYNEGDRISREGDRANHLYLIKEGSAELVVGFGDSPVRLGTLQSGDAYGEIGLFNQDIRSASVVALSRCRVYVLSRSYLRKMVSQIPELANTFLQVLGRKLQTSHDEVVRLQKSVTELNCL